MIPWKYDSRIIQGLGLSISYLLNFPLNIVFQNYVIELFMKHIIGSKYYCLFKVFSGWLRLFAWMDPTTYHIDW